jgi:hypothetical protein
MDTISYNELTSSPPRGMDHAITSLTRLRGDGYLTLVDYATHLTPIEATVRKVTELKLQNPLVFREPVRAAIKLWDVAGPDYASCIGRGQDPIATLPIGILVASTLRERSPQNPKSRRSER